MAATSITPKGLPPEDPQALYDQAINLCGEGKYPESHALLERLVAMREAAHGPEHPKVAIALNGLAQVLLFLGDYPLARSTAERALRINEAVLGPNHLDVGRSLLWELALVLKHQNELDAAAEYNVVTPQHYITEKRFIRACL